MVRGGRVALGPVVVAASLTFSSGCRAPAPEHDLRIAFPYDLASLDPHEANNFEAWEQVSNVYESLVSLGPDLDLVPALAVSWSNPDALTWRFQLRQGVRFHDGSPLSAADVLYSITRLQGDESLAARTQINVVTGAAVEDGAVVLHTASPSARLLHELSQVSIVRAGSTHEGLNRAPNGTGPYAVESWIPRRTLRLRRNARYWGPRPPHDVVDVAFSATDETAASGLQSGRLSMAAHLGPGVAAAGPGFRLVRQSNPFVRHLGLDTTSPTLPGTPGVPNPFRRREVRQALDVAVDRSAIARAVSPHAVPERHIVSDRVFGRDATPGAPAPDPDEARRMLRVAGYKDGFVVTLHRARADRATEELVAQLARVGVRVTLETAPSITDFMTRLPRRDLGFWITADACLTGEAGGLLAATFHSRDPDRKLGLENYSGSGDPALDRAIEESDTILDPGPRLPVLQGAVRLAEQQLTWIPLYRNDALFAVDRGLAFVPRADLLVRYAEIGVAADAPGR